MQNITWIEETSIELFEALRHISNHESLIDDVKQFEEANV